MRDLADHMQIDASEVSIRLSELRGAHFPYGSIELFLEFTLEGSAQDFIGAVYDICDSDKMTEVEGVFLLEPRIVGGAVAKIRCDESFELGTVQRAYRSVSIYAEPDVAEAIGAKIKAKFGPLSLPSVQWWFHSQGKTIRHDIVLDPIPAIFPEYYPFLKVADRKATPDEFLREYIASDASLLFLFGPPGTGKTTLLRYMLQAHKMPAIVSYDEKMLHSDEIFVSFMMRGAASAMIIEDADDMLTARGKSGSAMISRFLNISDGLIKFRRKKLIFTTNLANFSGVDPALLRPGRCFDIVGFRPLDADEAAAAAAVAGRPDPERSVTLAELFNREITTAPGQPVGFRLAAR